MAEPLGHRKPGCPEPLHLVSLWISEERRAQSLCSRSRFTLREGVRQVPSTGHANTRLVKRHLKRRQRLTGRGVLNKRRLPRRRSSRARGTAAGIRQQMAERTSKGTTLRRNDFVGMSARIVLCAEQILSVLTAHPKLIQMHVVCYSIS